MSPHPPLKIAVSGAVEYGEYLYHKIANECHDIVKH